MPLPFSLRPRRSAQGVLLTHDDGTLEIYASLRCNLRCRHCYSSSGPDARSVLPQSLVLDAIDDVAALGFTTLAVSGGEPFLYEGLGGVLRHARAAGLRTEVTTNGTVLTASLLDELRPDIDRLTFSVDGPAPVHARIRESAESFALVCDGMRLASGAAIPFSVLCTITASSWRHIPWMASFALEQGADLLHLHLLERSGRAVKEMQDESVSDDVITRSYLLARGLRDEFGDRMPLRLDLLHRKTVLDDPALVYATPMSIDEALKQPAATLLDRLVLEEDGVLVPCSYGFARSGQIADLRRVRLRDEWPLYLKRHYPAFRQLCGRLWVELTTDRRSLFDWRAELVAMSHRRDPNVGLQNKDQPLPASLVT